jgi:hypothetical protein
MEMEALRKDSKTALPAFILPAGSPGDLVGQVHLARHDQHVAVVSAAEVERSLMLTRQGPLPTVGADVAQLVAAVGREVRRARINQPGNGDLFAQLGDEFGALSQALLETHRRARAHGPGRVREACVRLAAIALRLADEGDPAYGLTRENLDA